MISNSQRDLEVFTEAIQLPVEQRAAFLDEVCGQDERRRRRLDALLK